MGGKVKRVCEEFDWRVGEPTHIIIMKENQKNYMIEKYLCAYAQVTEHITKDSTTNS